MNYNYDLFLSYSRNSIDTAAKISDELEKYGLSVWFDRTDVFLGNEIYTNLSDVLTRAKEWLGVLLLMDQTFFSKEWCIRELDLSIQNQLYLYPILNMMEKSIIPEKYSFLKSFNMVTIRCENDIDYAINKILDVSLQRYTLPEKTINFNILFDKLVLAYNNHTRTNVEKVICADNLIRYLECTSDPILEMSNSLHANIVHNKCSKLFNTGKLDSFDIKVVCHATDIFLEKIRPIE